MRNEILEEMEEQSFREGEKQIVANYYTDPDADMREIGSSILHDKFVAEYEPNPEQKKDD